VDQPGGNHRRRTDKVSFILPHPRPVRLSIPHRPSAESVPLRAPHCPENSRIRRTADCMGGQRLDPRRHLRRVLDIHSSTRRPEHPRVGWYKALRRVPHDEVSQGRDRWPSGACGALDRAGPLARHISCDTVLSAGKLLPGHGDKQHEAPREGSAVTQGRRPRHDNCCYWRVPCSTAAHDAADGPLAWVLTLAEVATGGNF
ncbi:hypothetical protein B0H13DRAFT_2508653, partial [Mycena leptocephala]